MYEFFYGKCPNFLNTLFRIFLVQSLLFMQLFPKIPSEMALKEQSSLIWVYMFANAILSATLVYKILGHLPFCFQKCYISFFGSLYTCNKLITVNNLHVNNDFYSNIFVHFIGRCRRG